MRSRYKNRRRGDRKVFSRTADKTHYKNLVSTVMRGGIRL